MLLDPDVSGLFPAAHETDSIIPPCCTQISPQRTCTYTEDVTKGERNEFMFISGLNELPPPLPPPTPVTGDRRHRNLG